MLLTNNMYITEKQNICANIHRQAKLLHSRADCIKISILTLSSAAHNFMKLSPYRLLFSMLAVCPKVISFLMLGRVAQKI